MKKLNQKQRSAIKQKIDIGAELMIVRLNVMADKTLSNEEANSNIYCINHDYEILWQIKAKPTGFEQDSFISISYDGKSLIAKNFSGFRYKVNLVDGETEEIGWDK